MSRASLQEFPRARLVDELTVDELPRGVVTRLMVELGHDGLGAAIRLPVLVARGERKGPVFGMTAAVHGNELNGIPVIHRMFDRVDVSALKGTLVGVPVVNVPGFRRYERAFNDGRDLNHLMPGVPDGNEAQVFAHRLLHRIVNRFDYLLDLHTASFGRVNSLYIRADMTHPTTARMAYLLRPQVILHDPPRDRTLRGAAMEMGVPAITIEIGNPQRFHGEYIKRALVGVRAILAEVGMLPKRRVAAGRQPVLCEGSRWLFTDHGGLLEVFPPVTEDVEEGRVIARLTNVFGDVTREYRAPYTGVIIGKSTNPVAQTGARIVHLGVKAAEEDPRFYGRVSAEREGPAKRTKGTG
ncbi:MAG: succinylglutamate desuccinylase/aspartoacylase family protein [Myxococcota bacterium]